MSVATQITLSGVRKALAMAKRTGTFRGVKATTEDVKDTIRTVYHAYGPDQADRLVTGWNTAFDSKKTIKNVKKTGIPVRKLPKNAVAVSPKISRDTTSSVVRQASAPFKASRFSGSGDPRANVTGLARNEELKRRAMLAKRKGAAKAKAPKPGQVKPYDPPKRYGPNTRSEQRVDDLFGV